MNAHPERATLFDSAASRYDLYRPGYPPELIKEMLVLSGITTTSKLLEVGCGTGKATVLAAEAGCPIDCVEPGENLLLLARENCRRWPAVRFIRGRFEEVELKRNYYDLVFSAQAFHWTDPGTRWQRCNECLVDGGAAALVNNYSVPPEEGVGKEISALIERETGGEMKPWFHESTISQWTAEMEAARLFGPVRVRRHKWTRRCSAEQYVGLFGTFSDFLSLSPAAQGKVSDGIRKILTHNAGWIDHPYESVLLLARLSPRNELS